MIRFRFLQLERCPKLLRVCSQPAGRRAPLAKRAWRVGLIVAGPRGRRWRIESVAEGIAAPSGAKRVRNVPRTLGLDRDLGTLDEAFDPQSPVVESQRFGAARHP
jgi:hypothetical protein